MSEATVIVPVRPADLPQMAATRISKLEAQMALSWRDEALRYAGYACESCGYGAFPEDNRRWLEVHHVIPQSVIRREFRAVGREIIPSLLWDVRDAMVLCDEPAPNRCHTRHTNAFRRIPRSRLREAHYEFARELDGLVGDERFTARLEQEYPA